MQLAVGICKSTWKITEYRCLLENREFPVGHHVYIVVIRKNGTRAVYMIHIYSNFLLLSGVVFTSFNKRDSIKYFGEPDACDYYW